MTTPTTPGLESLGLPKVFDMRFCIMRVEEFRVIYRCTLLAANAGDPNGEHRNDRKLIFHGFSSNSGIK